MVQVDDLIRGSLGATLVTADRALLDFAGNGHFKAMDATA
jgi:hypothetical protein